MLSVCDNVTSGSTCQIKASRAWEATELTSQRVDESTILISKQDGAFITMGSPRIDHEVAHDAPHSMISPI